MAFLRTLQERDHWAESAPSPDQLLERALELAVSPNPAPRIAYAKTRAHGITRRGVIWLGQTCNMRCHFCYFLDRIQDSSHPEHAFMSLEKAKAVCSTLRETYGNDSVDIQGGEPTIHRHILELVRHCHNMGLAPTLITNALVLEKMPMVLKFKEAGVRDFLVSIHGLGPVFDAVVGLSGAHERQMRSLRNLAEAGVPFRFNCCMSRVVVPHLPAVARLAIATGANVVNFLTFNPFEDQSNPGKRQTNNVPRYSEVTSHLNLALDVLAGAGVEANVRYFPMCQVAERHRGSVFNWQQLPYDTHEWDFASWNWTNKQPQRMAEGPLEPPPPFRRDVRIGPFGDFLKSLWRNPRIQPWMKRAHGLAIRLLPRMHDRAELYRNASVTHAEQNCYRKGKECQACDLRRICDGFHGDYARMFGVAAAETIRLGGVVDDPTYFIRQQLKIVESAGRIA